MPTRIRTQPELADLIALARALERDERRTVRELRERERRLAPELPDGTGDRAATGLAWLDAIEREDEVVRLVHHRADTAFRVTGLCVALAAILVGTAATLGAFYFDGTGRVNTVAVLAVLVLIPGLLLVPFVFAAMPARVTRKLPGAGAVAAMARGLSPGRLAQWLWRVLARDASESMALVSERAGRHQRVYAGVQKWALLRWSQTFALWFQITALVISLILVVFTDLAFGWSTTLTTGDPSLDARRVHRVGAVVAAPWRWIIPDAQPSLELIEKSRYFRAASGPISAAEAARLGGWWRFVVLTIAVYGVLPRVITLGLAQARLRAAARATLIGEPGFSAVLRRLHAGQIETAAVEPESVDPDVASIERAAQIARRGPGTVRVVINWSAVPLDNGLLTAAFPEARVVPAGGSATLEQDAALIRDLGAEHGAHRGDVLIVVKGWEPPLMEFVDFVRSLRETLGGEAAEIVVLPAGLPNEGAGLVGATPVQYKLWRDKLARLGDPSLRVAADREEVMA